MLQFKGQAPASLELIITGNLMSWYSSAHKLNVSPAEISEGLCDLAVGQGQSSHAVTCSVLTLPLSCGSCLRYSPLKNWGQARVWQVLGVCSNRLKKQASTEDLIRTKKM